VATALSLIAHMSCHSGTFYSHARSPNVRRSLYSAVIFENFQTKIALFCPLFAHAAVVQRSFHAVVAVGRLC